MSDIYLPDRRLIIEAKNLGDLAESYRVRQNIKTALAQLLDYARFIDDPKLAVLLDTDVNDDIRSLLYYYGIGIITDAGYGIFEESWPDQVSMQQPDNRLSY
ncbi:hypothetical protein [Desulfuromonas versatilis]|uniref:hypothetical protein n=1 Tax=Desulfuromonas versatilis TaxID=2802975 RepID=UPI001C85C360|nr:hypothetical protein [Desulfuromonas versatilis]